MNAASKLTNWDKIMMAITFAEAGETVTAKRIMEEGDRDQKRPEKAAENRPSLEL